MRDSNQNMESTSPRLRVLSGVLRNHAIRLEQSSAIIPQLLARNMDRLALGWMVLFAILAVPAALFSITPARSPAELASLILPYMVIAVAPVTGLLLTLRAFPTDRLSIRTQFHFSRYGRWQELSAGDARSRPEFGPAGFMASLLIGLLLNVVVRAIEFLVAVPALSQRAPEWGQALFHLMAADVAVMGFFYMACFVMALRSVPYFPKMLLFAWCLDILVQLLIAREIGPIAGLPAPVAQSLRDLLEGNISKVLISAFVWIPYLVLSDRVNITYRSRVRLTAQ